MDSHGIVTINTNNSGSPQELPINKQVQELLNNKAQKLHTKNAEQ